MQENTDRDLGLTSEEIINECMVLSAVQSTELALESGLRKDQIIISCKTSRPRDLIAVYRDLSRRTDQPLHLGLTEAGMGIKGLVWSAAAMGVLLNEGIGDTIRVSLTPRPGGDRREEVYAACELLQALGLRSFSPSVTACPGCGRTTSSTFQELAERTQDYIRERMPEWKTQYEGVETMTLAVMGCVVNGPGESKAASIGISLPGTGEAPNCPVYIDGAAPHDAARQRTTSWRQRSASSSTITSRRRYRAEACGRRAESVRQLDSNQSVYSADQHRPLAVLLPPLRPVSFVARGNAVARPSRRSDRRTARTPRQARGIVGGVAPTLRGVLLRRCCDRPPHRADRRADWVARSAQA